MNPAPAIACPRCGTAVPHDAPADLCPVCLLAQVLETEPLSAHAMPALLPEVLVQAFPHLDILEPIGAGGMGRVYKVRQPHLDRMAALKILPPELASDPAWVERFHREARALARLNHPQIVQLFDFGETAGAGGGAKFAYLLMEYVDGVTLRQAMKQGGLTAQEALLIIPKLCDALHYAHERGVLHRDLKPENILLDAQGGIKVADFGLAKFVHEEGAGKTPSMLTESGIQLGTAAYMAPEQVEHPEDVDHRADIYSLGVVFYEMLTGGLPLGRFPAPSERSGVDSRLDRIVFRTLEKLRERRYQHADEVSTAVRSVVSEPQKMPRQVSARLLLVILFLGVTGGVFWFFFNQPRSSITELGILPLNDLSTVITGVSMDPAISIDGNGSLKIVAQQGAQVTVGELSGLAVLPGETLWCEVRLRAVGIDAGAGLEMWCEFADGALAISRGPDPVVQGTQEWQPIRLPMQVAGAHELRRVWLNVVVGRIGTVWVDDIRFTADEPAL